MISGASFCRDFARRGKAFWLVPTGSSPRGFLVVWPTPPAQRGAREPVPCRQSENHEQQLTSHRSEARPERCEDGLRRCADRGEKRSVSLTREHSKQSGVPPQAAAVAPDGLSASSANGIAHRGRVGRRQASFFKHTSPMLGLGSRDSGVASDPQRTSRYASGSVLGQNPDLLRPNSAGIAARAPASRRLSASVRHRYCCCGRVGRR